MADENAKYFYHKAVSLDPMRSQATANTILWDRNSGDPFDLPPGRDPSYYIAKGYKQTPPQGWVPDGLHIIPPLVAPKTDPWQPNGERHPLAIGYDKILADAAKEKAKETELKDQLVAQQGRLAEAIEVIAGTKGAGDEAPRNKGGRPRKVREPEPEQDTAGV